MTSTKDLLSSWELLNCSYLTAASNIITAKYITVEWAPHATRTNTSSLSFQRTTSRSQILSVYDDSSWNMTVLDKPHPFFLLSPLNKQLPVPCNVRTVQQNLLLLTRKQFHVLNTDLCPCLITVR